MNGCGVLRLATLGLIGVAVGSLAGGITLVGLERTLPDGLIALGSASVGALSTLLTSNHGASGGNPESQ